MYDVVILEIDYLKLNQYLIKIKEELKNSGSLFCICKSSYDKDLNVEYDVFNYIKTSLDLGYEYVNTVVFPLKQSNNALIQDNVSYMVWLSKNKAQMYFNKDAIREKHIWKDVEWGKREKNYNKKGKDPGNVWIPTLDDGKGKITKHILMEKNDIIERILKSTYLQKAKIIIPFNSNIENRFKDYNCDFEFVEEVSKVKKKISKEIKNSKTYSDKISAKVFFETSEHMDKIKNSSIQTIVTSPPYWNLKDYFKKGQIGQEDYETYILRMNKVWFECYKKLNNKGSMWVNINVRVHEGKVILLPYDFIAQCRKIGFYYKGIIVWHKSSGIPTIPKNIVDRFEYVLLFTKDNCPYINCEKFLEYKDYKNEYINKGAIWNINRKFGSIGQKFIHPAIYPNELAKRLIEISSEKGQIVLDPFLGSGTTLISALNCGRSFIGYEYNEGFKTLMTTRFKKDLKINPYIVLFE